MKSTKCKLKVLSALRRRLFSQTTESESSEEGREGKREGEAEGEGEEEEERELEGRGERGEGGEPMPWLTTKR